MGDGVAGEHEWVEEHGASAETQEKFSKLAWSDQDSLYMYCIALSLVAAGRISISSIYSRRLALHGG